MNIVINTTDKEVLPYDDRVTYTGDDKVYTSVEDVLADEQLTVAVLGELVASITGKTTRVKSRKAGAERLSRLMKPSAEGLFTKPEPGTAPKSEEPMKTRRSKYPEDAELEWLHTNPKKRGASAERAAAYWGAATVGDMLAAGATRADVSWDINKGYVRIK